jgi:hypothetical protein
VREPQDQFYGDRRGTRRVMCGLSARSFATSLARTPSGLNGKSPAGPAGMAQRVFRYRTRFWSRLAGGMAFPVVSFPWFS